MTPIDKLIAACIERVAIPEHHTERGAIISDMVRKVVGVEEAQLGVCMLMDAAQELGEYLVGTDEAKAIGLRYSRCSYICGSIQSEFVDGVATVRYGPDARLLQMRLDTTFVPFSWHESYGSLRGLVVTNLVSLFSSGLASARRFREQKPGSLMVVYKPSIFVQVESFPRATITIMLPMAAEV